MSGIPVFPKFDVYADRHTVGVRWRTYTSQLENLFVGMNIDSKKRKKALLLHYAGSEVFGVYETLDLATADDNYQDTKDALQNYFNPIKNTEFEKYQFRNIKQMKGQTIDEFVTKLHQKAEHCGFDKKDAEIKSQLIAGCSSEKLLRKCLEEDFDIS